MMEFWEDQLQDIEGFTAGLAKKIQEYGIPAMLKEHREQSDSWLGKMIKKKLEENPDYAGHLETAGFGYMTREQVQLLWMTDESQEPEEEKTVKIEIREMGGVYQARGLFQWNPEVYERFTRVYPRWRGRKGNTAQAMLGPESRGK